MSGYLPHIINCSLQDLHLPRSVPVTALETKKAASSARGVLPMLDWPILVTSSNCRNMWSLLSGSYVVSVLDVTGACEPTLSV
jgi:hypothetical protein